MGVAAYCQEPVATAITWSKEYKNFNESEVITKIENWKNGATGPTLCEKFMLERPDGCKSVLPDLEDAWDTLSNGGGDNTVLEEHDVGTAD